MPKEILYDIQARDGLKRGVDKLANAVKVTLGPKGRYVVIEHYDGNKQVTKDGVTVAREINLPDSIENLGAEMVKEVALNTNELAGDGTTTATILAQALIAEGLKNVVAGANPLELKKGIDKTVSSIIKKLNASSIKVKGDVETIRSIATVSANNDVVIGDLIAQAFKKVGEQGVIMVEEGRGLETSVEVVKGYRFNNGYTSPYFINVPELKTVDILKPVILIYDGKITNADRIIEYIHTYKLQDIVIITTDIDEGSIMNLVMEKINNKINIVVIKAPYRGGRRVETLKDIAVLVGAQVLNEEKGHTLSMIKPAILGSCEKLTVTKSTTTITNGRGIEASINNRIAVIEKNIETFDTEYEKNLGKERIAKMQGGIAILYVGAPSTLEVSEKRDRVDDALSATKAAIEEGIVIGGGLALVKASKAVYKVGKGDEKIGASIVIKAIVEPFSQIIRNGGRHPEVILNKLSEGKNKNAGYDAKNDIYCDMITEGIIDPVKVVRIALENAASVAGMVLTTDCALINIKE